MLESLGSLKRIKEFVLAAEHGDFSLSLPEESEGELGELERAVNRLVLGLRKTRWEKTNHELIEKELRIARAIQASLLPATMPSVPGIEWGALYRPAQEIGGDYYDVIEIDSGHIGIVIADVSGKSISGAMFMAITRNTLRAEAMLSLSPSEVLKRTARLLIPSMTPGFFVSIFYAVLDTESWRLSCANAGHPPVLFHHFKENRSEWIHPKGVAVGIFRPGPMDDRPGPTDECEVCLEEGDIAFFYTDGVSEMMGADGGRFGRDRIMEVVQEAGRLGAGQFLATLEKRLVQFSAGETQKDDIAAVVLQRK